MQAEWRLSGWPKFFGRTPGPKDIIVPSLKGPEFHRTLRNGLERLKQDCELLGIAPVGGARPTVTQHECRNTFVTLATAGGAPEAWVRRITHNASGDVLAGYMVNDWAAMCDAVMAIKVERRRGAKVIALPRAVGDRDRGDEDDPDDDGYGLVMASGGRKAKTPAIARVSERDGRDSNPRPPA